MTEETRPLPQAVGAEKSVLSSILKEPATMMPLAIEHGVCADAFHGPGRRALFEVLAEYYGAGKEIELVTLIDDLQKRGILDRMGGPSSIADLYTYAPTEAHFELHCQEVKDRYLLRRVAKLGGIATEAAHDATSAQEAIGAVEKELTAIGYDAQTGSRVLSMAEILSESISAFEDRIKGRADAQGLHTIGEIDDKLKGLHPGRLWVVGAYPGGGKSVIASQILSDVAIAGAPCLFLSLEMPERDIVDRMVIQAARIEARAYTDPKAYCRDNQQGQLSVGVLNRAKIAVGQLKESPLRVHKPANRKLSTVISAIRRAHREMGIKAAAVDYVQIIRPTTTEGGDAGMREISNALQECAQDLGIHILALSQLNNDGDTKHGRVIEEDADAVLTIIQDRNKESETYKKHRHILIVKDRYYGNSGVRVPLVLDMSLIRFVHGEDETAAAPQKPSFHRD